MLRNLYLFFGIILTAIGAVAFVMSRAGDASWLISASIFAAAAFDFYLALRQRAMSASERRTDQILARAAKLSESDPIEAERLLDELFIPEGERASREIEELRLESAMSPAAAQELVTRLRETLSRADAMKESFQKRMKRDPQLPIVLSNMDRVTKDTRRLLKEAENNLRRLRAG